MNTFYIVLQNNFKHIKKEFPEAKMENILAIDVLSTDGMATDAMFKIIFTHHGIFLTTVYVNNDGGWFMTADSILVKNAMKSWIQTTRQL